MFTITQEAKINAYFKMVSGKLKELYDLCEKDPETNMVIIKEKNLDISLIANENIVGLTYYHLISQSCMNYIVYIDKADEKSVVTDKSSSMYFGYTEGGNIIASSIGVQYANELSSKRKQLSAFNLLTPNFKKYLENAINKIADKNNVSAPVIEDFSLSEDIINEEITFDDSVEKILAAAIKSCGRIIIGKTHADCGYNAGNDLYTVVIDENAEMSIKSEDGYITSTGEFVDSHEAWYIANNNGLISENVQCFGKYSEDFYRACGTHFDLSEARAAIIRHYKKDVQTLNRKKKDVEVD